MVLLVEKFAKRYFKLETSHHHSMTHPPPEELSSSLLAFRSHLSKSINHLLAMDLKPKSETLSLSWFIRCFGFFPLIDKALTNLVVDIDYPMSKWEIGSTEGYLSYTLSLLELLNSMSSSLSHVGHARLSLAHGLTLVHNSPSVARRHLKALKIKPWSVSANNFGNTKDYDKARSLSHKEWIVCEAVKEVKSIVFWLCGVLLSCLYGDCKPYMELRKIAGGFDGSLVGTLDFKISEQFTEKMPIFNEIKEVNDTVADLVVASDEIRHDAVMELERKVNVLEKLLDDVSTEVDNLFADVMTRRSELIEDLRT